MSLDVFRPPSYLAKPLESLAVLLLPLLDDGWWFLTVRHEDQGGGIHAIAQSGGVWSVIEDMAKV